LLKGVKEAKIEAGKLIIMLDANLPLMYKNNRKLSVVSSKGEPPRKNN
jgi:hypothetical protein